jgi:drug/metabolite transporter (DMT)-like permease
MTDNQRGILAILGASFAFVVNDAIVKLVSSDLPIGELIFVRGVLATALIGAVAWWYSAMRPLRLVFTVHIGSRVALSGIATVLIVLALKYLPLATVTAVLQTTPLAVTAGSAIFFKEQVGWQRWMATLAGFMGVMLIVRPTGVEGAGTFAVLAIAALVCTTARDLSTRLLDRDIPSMYVATMSSALIMLSGLVFIPFEDAWIVPSGRVMVLLAVASVCLLFAYNLVIYAMRTGELSAVSPFRYTLIPVALLLGFLVWGDVPDALAMTGIGLVAAAGLYALYREGRASRRVAATARGAA